MAANEIGIGCHEVPLLPSPGAFIAGVAGLVAETKMYCGQQRTDGVTL
jgi:hypothetical protein